MIQNASLLKYRIQSPQFEQNTQIVRSDFVVFDRAQRFDAEKKIIDAYGSSWLLIWFDNPEIQIKISPQQNAQSLRFNPCACFVPPYSIIQWQIPKCSLRWSGFMSESILPNDLRSLKEAFCFDVKNEKKPTNLNEIVDLILSSTYLKCTDRQIIEKKNQFSGLAQIVKKEIEEHYFENLKITELAKSLNLNRIYMSREFKKTFEFTPIEYRNRLRVFDALKRMRCGENVTAAAFSCGFENLTQFQDQFKKLFDVSPSEFCINKKIAHLENALIL
jgi:AraC-like DNA-binding protein